MVLCALIMWHPHNSLHPSTHLRWYSAKSTSGCKSWGEDKARIDGAGTQSCRYTIELYIRTRGRTGLFTRPDMRAGGHFVSQLVFVRPFCKLNKKHLEKNSNVYFIFNARTEWRLSSCGPVAFVQAIAASPVRPLILINYSMRYTELCHVVMWQHKSL